MMIPPLVLLEVVVASTTRVKVMMSSPPRSAALDMRSCTANKEPHRIALRKLLVRQLSELSRLSFKLYSSWRRQGQDTHIVYENGTSQH
eukprot:6478435-Amphidinium_carterae.1